MRLSSCLMMLTFRLPWKVTITCVFGMFGLCLTHLTGAIMCKFRASGQTCICANRIYVQSSVYSDFASRLAERVATLKVGNGLDSDTSVSASEVLAGADLRL
jgi:hypothetical protein